MTFGERLRELRTSDERSLDYVARMTGLSKTYVWELEKGRASPSAVTLAALAAHYGKTMDQLWKGK
jgi:transcriptional regulator with XRE-family HTH domain